MLTKRKNTYKKSMIAMSLILALHLTGCAQNSTELKPCHKLTIPALSQSAQTPQPIDSCLPSCLENLTKSRERMAQRLINSESH